MTKKKDHIMPIPTMPISTMLIPTMPIPTMPIPTMSIPTMPIPAPPPIGSSTPHPRCEAGQSFPVHGIFFLSSKRYPFYLLPFNFYHLPFTFYLLP